MMDKTKFGPLLLVVGAIATPILAAQIVKSVMTVPKTPQETVDSVTKGIYAYGGTAAALALLAGYTTGAVQAVAVGGALSTGILAGHAASVLMAIPKDALKAGGDAAPKSPAVLNSGVGLPGVPRPVSAGVRRHY